MLAIAIEQDMEIKQVDVDSAFLYRDLDNEIYLKEPKGFRINGTNGEKLVCKLCKAIYGLKQAKRVWSKLIDSELKDIGFKSCTKDICVYTRHTKGYLFLLAIYIDDLVIASKSIGQIVELKRHLQKMFSMKPIGDIDFVLGLKIERDRGHKKLKLR